MSHSLRLPKALIACMLAIAPFLPLTSSQAAAPVWSALVKWGPAQYGNGQLMPSTKTYAVFWLPPTFQGSPAHFEPSPGTDSRYETSIRTFLGDLGGTSFYNLLTQYSTSTYPITNNSTFGGYYVDTGPYVAANGQPAGTPSQPLYDADFRAEVTSAMNHPSKWLGGSAPVPSASTMVFVFMADNVVSCETPGFCSNSNICSYHYSLAMSGTPGKYSWGWPNSSNPANVSYAVMPAPRHINCMLANSPLLDLDGASEVNWMSHELFESVTDTAPSTGWTGPATPTGNEIGDPCQFVYGTVASDHGNVTLAHGHRYLLQSEWSNAANDCAWSYTTPTPTTVSLASDNATPALGTTVHLTATTNLALDGTKYSISILNTTSSISKTLQTCTSGVTCSLPQVQASATTIKYQAVLKNATGTVVARSATVPVTWSKQILPGGLWGAPANGAAVGDSVAFSAQAYPSHTGDPPIDHVNFTANINGAWTVLCTATPPPSGRVFSCNGSLAQAPAGSVTLSFDVYDTNKDVNHSPNGPITVSHQAPATPTFVQATGKDTGTVQITWQAGTGVPAQGFSVERWNGSGWPVVGTTNSSGTSFTDQGLSPSTQYAYLVCATDSVGSSCITSYVSAWTYASAPGGLQAKALDATDVQLSWSESSGNILGYQLSDGSGYQTASASPYTWSNLQPNTYYCFAVEAQNNAGYSAWSQAQCLTTPRIIKPSGTWIQPNDGQYVPSTIGFSANAYPTNAGDPPIDKVNFTAEWNGAWHVLCTAYPPSTGDVFSCNGDVSTAPPGPITVSFDVYDQQGNVNKSPNGEHTVYYEPPAIPTGVQATATDPNDIKVTWADGGTNTEGFLVTDGVTEWDVGYATSFTDSGLAPGSYRCFFVAAYNASGVSAWSDQSCTSTPNPPATPTDVQATALDPNDIKVTWADGGTNTQGFEVTDGVHYWDVGYNTSFTDSGLSPGTYKCYFVSAYNADGWSDWSDQSCTTTPSPPADPVNVQANALDANDIQVTWQDGGSNTDGFQVSDGTNYWDVGYNTSFTDSGLSAGTYKCYYVIAYNSSGWSNWVGPSCAGTPSPPADPQGLEVNPLNNNAISVMWADGGSNTDGFEVSDGTNYWDVGYNTSFTDSGLSPGTYKCYYVAAYNSTGSSNWVGPSCTSTLTIVPGGEWIQPNNGQDVGNTVQFSAYAYPTGPTDPAIDYVNFTGEWNGTWHLLCTAYAPSSGDVFSCAGNVSAAGQTSITVSFGVYDQIGDVNYSPNGERTIYLNTGSCSITSWKDLQGWLPQGGGTWSVSNGMLMFDGASDGTNQGGIVSPCQTNTPDFAIEAQIEAINDTTTAQNGSFVVWGHGSSQATDETGIGGGIYMGSSAAVLNSTDVLDQEPYQVDSNWHDYKLEVYGDQAYLYIDGSLIAQGVSDQYLDLTNVGMTDVGYAIAIRSFRVSPLP